MPHQQPIDLQTGEDAVLLLHGLASSPLEMRSLANALRQRGFNVEVPHIRGLGFGTDASDFRDWQVQALAVFDRLKRDHRSVSVGGLCTGAVLALSLAAERPREVSALSLLSTTLFYDGWSIPWYRFLMPLWFHTPIRNFYTLTEQEPYGIKNRQIRQRIARAMRRGFSEAGAARITTNHVYQATRLGRHVMRNLHTVTAPALVIHAIDDETASPKSAEYVVKHIGSPIKQKVFLGNSYHMITLDNEREAVAWETNNFFRSNIGDIPAVLPDQAVTAGNPARIAAGSSRR